MGNDLLGSVHLNNKYSTLCVYLITVEIVEGVGNNVNPDSCAPPWKRIAEVEKLP